MANHTPGPWTAQYRAGDKPAWIILAGSDRSILITRLLGYDVEDAANARLIAAAPELREACERLLNLARFCADAAGDVEEWNAGGEAYETTRVVRQLLNRIDHGA